MRSQSHYRPKFIHLDKAIDSWPGSLQELFKCVMPHQCMGCVWTGRDKKRLQAPSVYATVNQFNAVSYRVIAITLKRPDLLHSKRALIIEKWIDIAQVCTILL